MPYGGQGRVQRHHRDGNRMNNDRSNIEFLCVKAHKDAHQALDGRVGGGARPRVTALMREQAIERLRTYRFLIRSGMTHDETVTRMGVHSTSPSRWIRKYD